MADRARIEARLKQLWSLAHGPAGGADRPAYSAAEARAMELIAGWAREHGLEPGIDDYGNLWALPAGWDGPVITSGSHVDTVPDGGRFDGALGTVLGLELAAELGGETATGARVGVLVCAAEEAPRFGAGTLGSRLLVGTLRESALDRLHDRAGVSAAAARDEYLQELRDLPRLVPPIDRLRGHAEVHVATRSSLRTAAVVAHVAAVRRYELTVTGSSGHAGEVPMDERHDALAAAAEIVLAIEDAAISELPQTVATVGSLVALPGAVSVIAREARLGIDVRGTDPESVWRIDRSIHERSEAVAARRGVAVAVRLVRDTPPVELDRELRDAALASAKRLGVALVETWSGAGHDSQHLSALAPALLIFVPLHGGESHTPDEGAEIGEILDAARVVSAVVASL